MNRKFVVDPARMGDALLRSMEENTQGQTFLVVESLGVFSDNSPDFAIKFSIFEIVAYQVNY
ncbi:hypothetical protein [Burkholderia sp. BCC0405]|uniref:hypothetical protein n=1 Tax=Burkholderia sp. BCC0405 TaxID=2676298 RepID=UPI00158ADAB8|nr:hypothetical protein [Burkholderia sp. BCC0405]